MTDTYRLDKIESQLEALLTILNVTDSQKNEFRFLIQLAHDGLRYRRAVEEQTDITVDATPPEPHDAD